MQTGRDFFPIESFPMAIQDSSDPYKKLETVLLEALVAELP
jgi:hypothetical protein